MISVIMKYIIRKVLGKVPNSNVLLSCYDASWQETYQIIWNNKVHIYLKKLVDLKISVMVVSLPSIT